MTGSSRLIQWPEETVDLHEHLRRMLEHEILHHGMFSGMTHSHSAWRQPISDWKYPRMQLPSFSTSLSGRLPAPVD
jgi:hypothetical protein